MKINIMVSMAPGPRYLSCAPEHLPAVLRLTTAQGWPAFAVDPARALRALTAPGVTTVVCPLGEEMADFAQAQGDGAIQAHLSALAVAGPYRRQGIGGRLVQEALRRTGCLRMDLLAEAGAELFYRTLPHRAGPGFRVYREDGDAPLPAV